MTAETDIAGAGDLDAHLRRVDPDRWLAARFIADPGERADVLALYALDWELARIPAQVSEALVGEIRFAWWREQLDAILAGRAAGGHPVAELLAAAAARRSLSPARLHALVDARERGLDPPPQDEAELSSLAEGTGGSVMALAAGVLGADEDAQAAAGSAGRAWGLAMLAARRGEGGADDALGRRIAALARAAVKESRRALPALPVRAFPAVAYAALARPYAEGRPPGELGRRFALILAVARGRL